LGDRYCLLILIEKRMIKRKIFLVSGLPGSGKGTQAIKIAEALSLNHISSGQLIRNAINSGLKDDFHLEVKKRYDKGIIQPDSVANRLVDKKLEELNNSPGVVFDSYPLNLGQAMFLKELIKKYNFDKPIFIFIKVDKNQIISRLSKRKVCSNCGAPVISKKDENKCKKCGGNLITRSDDQPMVVKTRIENYLPNLERLIEFFTKNGQIINIDGNKTIEEVSKELFQKLAIKND